AFLKAARYRACRAGLHLQPLMACATMSAMRKFVVIAFLLLSSCSGTPGKTTLIVYSPHGKELLTEFEKRFEAQNPNIDVRWLDMGSQDALDRVRSEK